MASAGQVIACLLLGFVAAKLNLLHHFANSILLIQDIQNPVSAHCMQRSGSNGQRVHRLTHICVPGGRAQ